MAAVTLKQVAEAAGVSVQTASHILNTGHSKPYRAETREKVLEAARILDYRPNAAARSMVNRQSRIIGLVTPSLRPGWFAPLDVFELMQGINTCLAPEGYVTSIVAYTELAQDEPASRAFREQMLDAVIVTGIAADSPEQFQAMAPHCLWCDTNRNEPFGCVRRDEFLAGRMVAEHLVGQGYRSLVWVGYANDSGHYSHVDRLAGVQSVAEAGGILFVQVACRSADLGKEIGEIAGHIRPNAAVLAENHHFALAVLARARDLDRIVGKDFGLAACDISHERNLIWPGLTGAVVNRGEVGRQTAEMALQILQGKSQPSSILIRPVWNSGDTAPGTDGAE